MDDKRPFMRSNRTLEIVLLGLGTIVGLFFASRYNYLLFHTLAEGFSITVASVMFVLAWNTWELTDHGYLKFLGVAFLFIGGLDLVHTLAYKGMGIFPGYDANLSTQLWIAARYVQALTLLIAPAFLHRKLRRRERRLLVNGYAILTAALLTAIFARRFPDCYIEDQGLTQFKIISEYLIGLLLVGAIWQLVRHRDAFASDIFRWLVAALAFTIISELAFTFYVSVYGLSNLIGHIFKIFAFYSIYHAIVETGLRKPYALIFRELQERNERLAQEVTERKRAEDALRESNRKLNLLFDILPVGVSVLNQEREVSKQNRALGQILDISEEGLRRGDYRHRQYLRADGSPMPAEEFPSARVISGEEAVHDVEVGVVKEDGTLTWTSVSAVAPSLVDWLVVIVTTDITERKQAEEALRESEAELAAIVESSPFVMMVVDREWRVQKVKDKNRKFIENPPSDILGFRCGEAICCIHADDAPEGCGFGPLCEECPLRQAVLDTIDTNKSHHAVEVPMTFAHQEVVEEKVLLVYTTPLELADERQALVVLQDITERKRAEDALRESEKRFRTIIDALPQFVSYTDKNLTYRFVSRTYQEKFGVASEEVVGKTLPEVIGEEAFEEARPHVEKALQGEQVRYHERYDYAIGGTRDIDGILVPDVAEDGTVRGYYAVLTDITPYMEMQEELRRTTGRLRILHDIDAAILRAQSPEEIAIAALERLYPLIPCRHTSIAEIDSSQQQGRDMIILVDGELQARMSNWRPLSYAGPQLTEAIRQGQPYIVHDMAAVERLSPLEQMLEAAGLRSYISIPLLVQNTPIGTLNLASEKPDFFQPEHVDILEDIAASLAVALQQAQLLEQTKQDAETKSLLLREVNHRVKNNLDAIIGLLYVERRHAPPDALPAYRSIMDDLTQRITGLAEVHQMLTGVEWAPLNLGELAERIIQITVRSSKYELNIELDITPSPVRVNPAQAQHLALILSELTTNTLKHSANSRDAVRIAVQIAQKDGIITLIYWNDGPGYPEDVLRLERHSAGLDIVKRSVRKNLQGELSLRNQNGAVTEIRFKAESRK